MLGVFSLQIHILGECVLLKVLCNLLFLVCVDSSFRQLAVLFDWFSWWTEFCMHTLICVCEHMFGVFSLLMNIFGECAMLEVVCNFFVLVCVGSSFRQLVVLFDWFCGGRK